MKKNILASTALLSVALISNTAFAEENTTTTTLPVTEKAEAETRQPVADAPKQDSKPELKQPKAEEAAKPAAATEQPKEKPASTVQKDGWKKEENIWRYYTNNVAEKDWKKISGKWYFFDKDGVMLENTTYDGYVFNKDGAMVENSWALVNDKWYYAQESGKYIQNKWEKINGKWYYFDKDGVMLANTTYDGYVFNKDGAMVENSWTLVNNKWYYAQESGKYIQNKWEKINGKWYFFNKDGIMLANTTYDGYVFNKDGAMVEKAWALVNDKWYYAQESGKYIQNKWEKINGKWYFFDKDGVMQANKWQGRYYLKDSGAMAESEWVFDKNYNSWFYLKANGAYAENEWSGDYYLKKGGYMAMSEWVDDYWVDETGKYVKNAWVDDNRFYVGNNGKKQVRLSNLDKTKKEWVKSGDDWYYNKNGILANNEWVGNYWLGDDGRMVTNAWVDNDKYYVGPDGAWIKNLSTVMNIARSYLGVTTDSAEHKKIVDAYNSVSPKPVGYTATYSDDWCDIFVTTVFQQAGLSDLIGRECGVQRHINIMQKKGIWQGKAQPKAGDIVTFDWDGGGFADHIGIVESVINGKIHTIEGNSALPGEKNQATKVNRKSYDWNANTIKGYARPNY